MRRKRGVKLVARFASGAISKTISDKGYTYAWSVEGIGIGWARNRKLAEMAVAAHTRGRKLRTEIVEAEMPS